jgi:hypothetical protein
MTEKGVVLFVGQEVLRYNGAEWVLVFTTQGAK